MIRELKTCEICGAKFKAHHNWNRFCGRACGVLGRSGPTKKRPVKLNCSYCGKPYERSPLDSVKSKFCSNGCHGKHKTLNNLGGNNPNFRNAGWKKCCGCHKMFKHYNKTRRFCSRECTMTQAKSFGVMNARIGTRTEKKAVKILAKLGYRCTLSQGSRGAFDIIAVSAFEIILIQVKFSAVHHRRCLPKARRAFDAVVVPSSPLIRKQIVSLVEGMGWYVWENGKERKAHEMDATGI